MCSSSAESERRLRDGLYGRNDKDRHTVRRLFLSGGFVREDGRLVFHATPHRPTMQIVRLSLAAANAPNDVSRTVLDALPLILAYE